MAPRVASVAPSDVASQATPCSYDRSMRAVVVGALGEPELAEVPEPPAAPSWTGEIVRVLACGLCGSDIEKLLPRFAGRVLGHEVVAETSTGQRVALVHHAPCGSCPRCLSGHETTCARFPDVTIVPGGFTERVHAKGWVDLPVSLDDAQATGVEPL